MVWKSLIWGNFHQIGISFKRLVMIPTTPPPGDMTIEDWNQYCLDRYGRLPTDRIRPNFMDFFLSIMPYLALLGYVCYVVLSTGCF